MIDGHKTSKLHSLVPSHALDHANGDLVHFLGPSGILLNMFLVLIHAYIQMNKLSSCLKECYYIKLAGVTTKCQLKLDVQIINGKEDL